MEHRLLTVPEAAAQLGLGRSTLYQLIASGRIRTVRIGRTRRVPVAALDEFVACLEDDAASGLGLAPATTAQP